VPGTLERNEAAKARPTKAGAEDRSRRSSAPRSDTEPAVGQVLRRALRDLVRDARPYLPPAGESDENVITVEHDGVRYTLTQKQLPAPAAHVGLSAREQEIARMIATGHTNRTVAAVLEISCWTVDTHVRRIFAKLGVRSRSAMIAKLVDEGLLGKV
jgi:DNA-binding CsgD family transcriptional regulator